MRPASSLCLLLALSTGCAAGRAAQTDAPPAPAAPAPEPKKFSMRTYYLAFLRRGPAWTAERTPQAIADGQGHMANINRLAACGKLLIAGPFQQGPEAPQGALAGIFLFDVPTLEEAVALTQTDPAVKSGRFTVEVLPWFGPTGLTYEGHTPVAPNTPCAPAP
jgi:uncharacterized protein YciI